MWEMAKSSITLFLQGKLFAEPNKVFRQAGIGAAVTAVLLVLLAALGLPLVAAAALAGAAGGALQPYLFKDLRYR